jgi:hypothetical protein
MSCKHFSFILFIVLALFAAKIKAQDNSPTATGQGEIERLLERAEYHLNKNNDSCTLAHLRLRNFRLPMDLVNFVQGT